MEPSLFVEESPLVNEHLQARMEIEECVEVLASEETYNENPFDFMSEKKVEKVECIQTKGKIE